MPEALSMSNHQKLESYYKLHAPLFDITRWAFLFGRSQLIQLLPEFKPGARIMDVGCGTGYMLTRLAKRFPEVKLTGMDLSKEMLDTSEKKLSAFPNDVELIHAPFDTSFEPEKPVNAIIFTYTVTMMGSQVFDNIRHCYEVLNKGGIIAVVDFNATPWTLFRKWMAVNHVDLNPKIREEFLKWFIPEHDLVKPAYGGIWSYFQFVGRKSG